MMPDLRPPAEFELELINSHPECTPVFVPELFTYGLELFTIGTDRVKKHRVVTIVDVDWYETKELIFLNREELHV